MVDIVLFGAKPGRERASEVCPGADGGEAGGEGDRDLAAVPEDCWGSIVGLLPAKGEEKL